MSVCNSRGYSLWHQRYALWLISACRQELENAKEKWLQCSSVVQIILFRQKSKSVKQHPSWNLFSSFQQCWEYSQDASSSCSVSIQLAEQCLLGLEAHSILKPDGAWMTRMQSPLMPDLESRELWVFNGILVFLILCRISTSIWKQEYFQEDIHVHVLQHWALIMKAVNVMDEDFRVQLTDNATGLQNLRIC